MTFKSAPSIGLIGLTLLVAGCEVGPHYAAPALNVPAVFEGGTSGSARTPLSQPTPRNADLQAWWRAFKDPDLEALVARALAQNLDRKTAAARVRDARQAAVVARAGLFPTLDGNASATHTRISNNAGLSSLGSLFGGGGSASSGGAGGIASAGLPSLEFDSYQVGLDATWALDVFGGERRAARAAQERAEAEVWNSRDTDVTVISQVADAYLQLRTSQATLRVVSANGTAQSELLSLFLARAQGGLSTTVDIVEQRRQLASTQAQIPPLEAQIEVARHQLAILLGEAPDALIADLPDRGDTDVALSVPPEVPIGLPSDLLKRRPDIRRAERQLAASVEDVGRATAALYPSVSLTGTFSFLSTDLSTLLNSASRNYTYASQLTAPLFDAGSLRAQKHQTEARAAEAAFAYEKAVLSGLQDVADALSHYSADQRRLITLDQAVAQARRASALDSAQYLGGLADRQATLLAEQNALQSEQDLVQTRGQLLSDLVLIYRALGGGWENAALVSPSIASVKTSPSS